MIGVHDRHVELAQQRHEFRRAEAVVADLDDMAQRMPAEAVRQQFEKAAEIGRVEFFGRRELPQQGAKPVA